MPAGVLDAASYTPNLALGSVFVVKGLHLCPDGSVQAAGFPLPNTLNGVSIVFKQATGGTAVMAYMVYTYGQSGVSQLAAVLPSSVAPGAYLVSVTVNSSTSAAVPVTVVTRKFELVTADSSGTGAAALQTIDSDGLYHDNRFTTGEAPGAAVGTYAPAHAGDFVVAYGTGLGPVQIPDQGPSSAVDLRDAANVQVLVGGEVIVPSYAGRSPGYAGLDQINFQLPSDVATGCIVTIQVSVAGQLSSPATISIAPAGVSTCSPAPVGTDVLTRLDQGGTFTIGSFWLTQVTPPATQAQVTAAGGLSESAFGAFVRYTGFQLASVAALLPAPGSCQLASTVGSAPQLVFGSSGTYLDAGALTLTGAGMSGRQFSRNTAIGVYALPLGPNTVLPGAYQLAGGGGADIGGFTASVVTGQPMTVIGGLPTSIDRSKDLTLSWTGGTSGGLVSVAATSGRIIGGTADTPIYAATRLSCVAPADAGALTIPSSLLIQLPQMTDASNGIGYLAISPFNPPAAGNGMFAAPLTGGGNIDQGLFLGTLGNFATATYQ